MLMEKLFGYTSFCVSDFQVLNYSISRDSHGPQALAGGVGAQGWVVLTCPIVFFVSARTFSWRLNRCHVVSSFSEDMTVMCSSLPVTQAEGCKGTVP